ncbi:hypothetical protein [Streptomyces sp. NPDC018711]|uniref:hypothetical protein n=1 Tax=Streptomyces sp. NPDC018711 TaxID=3365052 RepID=UPI0037B06F5C
MGKQALRAAQDAGGGPYQRDGVPPVRTVLVEWPAEGTVPAGYWISNLPPDTPVEDVVRWARMRWRIEHDYRELKHGLVLDHFEGRTWRGRRTRRGRCRCRRRNCPSAAPVGWRGR